MDCYEIGTRGPGPFSHFGRGAGAVLISLRALGGGVISANPSAADVRLSRVELNPSLRKVRDRLGHPRNSRSLDSDSHPGRDDNS